VILSSSDSDIHHGFRQLARQVKVSHKRSIFAHFSRKARMKSFFSLWDKHQSSEFTPKSREILRILR
jgi:hypothetical protein